MKQVGWMIMEGGNYVIVHRMEIQKKMQGNSINDVINMIKLYLWLVKMEILLAVILKIVGGTPRPMGGLRGGERNIKDNSFSD